MPDKVANLIDKIASVKGQDYVNGLVDMANILAPDEKQEEKHDQHN